MDNITVNIFYRIIFFSEWHCGSGLSAGRDLDAVVIKEKNMYPIVPGKTIKGLVRNAIENLLVFKNENKKEFVTKTFGGFGENEQDIIQGSAFFTDAVISEDLKLKTKDLYPFFYNTKSSTQIDEMGLAKDSSLRKIETTIPCVLHGKIINVPEFLSEDIISSLGLIKQIGVNRTRGLGRCLFEYIKQERSR